MHEYILFDYAEGVTNWLNTTKDEVINGVCPHCGSDDFNTYEIIANVTRVSCCHKEIRTDER